MLLSFTLLPATINFGCAAEIIRYSTYQITDGYTEGDLKWTDEDTEKFISNFLSPEVGILALHKPGEDGGIGQIAAAVGLVTAHLHVLDHGSSGPLQHHQLLGFLHLLPLYQGHDTPADQGSVPLLL